MHPSPLSARELVLAVLALLLVASACLAPPIAQASGYHAFADTHTRWGLPHAGNLLSNLPFAAVGVALLLLRARIGPTEKALVRLTGVGLVLTALGSAWYHAAPGDSGLAVDRLAMCGAFAGLLGLAGCRASARSGVAVAALSLTGGVAAVLAWLHTGNLGPWVVVQAGGLVLLAWLAACRAEEALPVRWWLLIAGYVLAKAFEMGDHAVWAASGEWLSGHSLKHVVAALSVLPVLHALRVTRAAGQNAPQLRTTSA